MDGSKTVVFRWWWLLLAIAFSQGCAHGIISHRDGIAENAIPAHRLPDAFRSTKKQNLVPVDFTQLRRPPVDEHIIGSQDVLGVYIEDVLAVDGQLPTVNFLAGQAADSRINNPSVGHPVTVQSDGTVLLPLVGAVDVDGMSIRDAIATIKDPFVKNGFLTDRSLISVDLIRPRSVKVFVIREDADVRSAQQTRRESQIAAKRGSADALEMTIYENDVLHALSATGGLPGSDAFNEIWILRNGTSDARRTQLMADIQSGAIPDHVMQTTEFQRIPLRVCPGQELPFRPEDAILNDGDVVFIESRDIEYFLTGGLLSGGSYQIPRDHDVDILEAIAIANSATLGPTGSQASTNFRSGPGNIVAASNAIVVRKLPNGEQIKILADLRVAVNDPRERLIIMPQDLIILRYKPTEIFGNIALNFVNFNLQLQ